MKVSSRPTAPWFDAGCRAVKINTRGGWSANTVSTTHHRPVLPGRGNLVSFAITYRSDTKSAGRPLLMLTWATPSCYGQW